MTRHNLCYFGITNDPQDCLILAWSQTDENKNKWMTTVRALESLVGHKNLPRFKIAVDPDSQIAQGIHGRYVVRLHKAFMVAMFKLGKRRSSLT
ncbi:hypothetical protein SETIT_2G070200v2 [Setaria italica]|uniref:Uncharacterized protein n=1 Tax=Setaria italica TaxID=4555 RepID=A0A368PWF4_SETIT|nr:hypothetical protein SETIT_2G070200v2 [Setaria italica]